MRIIGGFFANCWRYVPGASIAFVVLAAMDLWFGVIR